MVFLSHCSQWDDHHSCSASRFALHTSPISRKTGNARGADDIVPSEPWLPWSRYVEGSVDRDAGAMIRDGIKVMEKLGVCPAARRKRHGTARHGDRGEFHGKNGRKMVGKWWEKGGETVGKWWEKGGETVGKWWENGYEWKVDW